jgi:hypothetical protein
MGDLKDKEDNSTGTVETPLTLSVRALINDYMADLESNPTPDISDDSDDSDDDSLISELEDDQTKILLYEWQSNIINLTKNIKDVKITKYKGDIIKPRYSCPSWIIEYILTIYLTDGTIEEYETSSIKLNRENQIQQEEIAVKMWENTMEQQYLGSLYKIGRESSYISSRLHHHLIIYFIDGPQIIKYSNSINNIMKNKYDKTTVKTNYDINSRINYLRSIEGLTQDQIPDKFISQYVGDPYLCRDMLSYL